MMSDKSILSLEVKVLSQFGQYFLRQVEAPPAVFLELVVISLFWQIGQSICLYIDIQLIKKPVEKCLSFCGFSFSRAREMFFCKSLVWRIPIKWDIFKEICRLI